MLPNSIERTAPIVGYDPYAYIMGKKSSFSYGMQNGGGIDYFAKKPEDVYKAGEKVKKKFHLTGFLKGILGIGAVAAGAAALIVGKDKAKAAYAAAEVIEAAPKAAAEAGEAGSKLGKIKDTVVNGAKGAWGTVSGKCHQAYDFIKNKFKKP